MASIKVADIFTQIGFKTDFRRLDQFQRRMSQVKRQLLELKRLARTPLSPNTNIAAVRALNTELARTARLARQIQNQGPIRVRPAGGGGRGGRGGGGPLGFFGSPGSNQGFAGGAFANLLGLRGGLASNFLAGFTGAVAVRSLFRASADLQGIEVALAAITRQGQETSEIFSFLRGESERLGFEFRTSALEFAKLAAAGNAAGLSTGEIQELFIGAQEAARVFNLSVADTEGVLKAFTQIVSKGKVTAEELRNQLGDRLPAAVPIFAAALGITTQELSLMLERGEILANETLPLFGKQLRATFSDQVPAAAQNITAALNRFRNSLFFFLAGLGESGVSEIFKIILIGASNLLDFLGPALRFIIRTVRLLLSPFQALGRIITRLANAMPGFTSALMAAGAAMFFLRNATLAQAKAFLAAALPVIGIGLAIGALVLLIDDLATALEGGDSVLARWAENGNVVLKVFARILLIFGELVIFVADLTAALLTLSFDPLTESLERFISRVRELSGLAAASSFVTDLLERAFIDDSQFGPMTFPAPVPNVAQPAPSGAMSVNVSVEGDTEVIRNVVTEVTDENNRQAQAEFGNNE